MAETMTESKSRASPHSPSSPRVGEAWAEPIASLAQSKLEAGLYLTATPIGNLKDITLRALECLAACDRLVCEDTRVTRKLLAAYGIKKTLTAYHDHNAAKMRPRLLDWLRGGLSVCLVSDAGLPLISDPGYRLVRAALACDVPVTVVPGASAPVTALAVSGLPTDQFFFAGFLPAKPGPRRRALAPLAQVPGSLIFFESPHRLAALLADIHGVLGNRPAAVARELTKKFEQVRRGDVAALAAAYQEQAAPKGEVVVVIGPAAETEARPDPDPLLRRALQTASTRDAVAEVAKQTGLSKKELYQRALLLGHSPQKGRS